MHSGRFSTRRTPVRVAAAALAAGTLCFSLIVAGSAGAVSNHKTKRLVLSTIQTSTYGTILFSGKTVYTLKASNVACTAKCQRIWPLLLLPKGVTKATAGRGVSAAKIGTVMRKGGARQVTYSGKPLYWFEFDSAPGQVNGNITDTWGKWSVVVMTTPAGASPVTGPTLPQSGTTTSTPHSSSTPNTMNTSPNSSTPATSPPVSTPPTTPPTSPPTTPPTPPPTTTPPTTTPTTSPPTTTTTSPGGGGVGF